MDCRDYTSAEFCHHTLWESHQRPLFPCMLQDREGSCQQMPAGPSQDRGVIAALVRAALTPRHERSVHEDDCKEKKGVHTSVSNLYSTGVPQPPRWAGHGTMAELHFGLQENQNNSVTVRAHGLEICVCEGCHRNPMQICPQIYVSGMYVQHARCCKIIIAP